MAGAKRGAALWQTAVGALGLVVVVWVSGDLYDIVTSGGERPDSGSGGHVPPVEHGPSGETPPGQGNGPTDQGEQPPPTSGAHDPSQYDHG